MQKTNERHFFAGGNTAQGFYSLFHYIASPHGKRLLIIKGGPGTGKSTLMKQVASCLLNRGFDTEHFYCSSDPNSLDGLSVPSLGFSMMDGTAPHVVDPRLPGAFDEIINLGAYWNRKTLVPYRQEIESLINKNSSLFTQAYQYLREAYVALEKQRYLVSCAMDYRSANTEAEKLLGELSAALPATTKTPQQRHLFAGALTPLGQVNFYASILQQVTNFYYLTGEPGTGKSSFLKRISDFAQRRGYDTEVYRCAFDPQRIDSLIIPSMSTAFIKVTNHHAFTLPPQQQIRKQVTIALNHHTNTSLLNKSTAERNACHERFQHLLGSSVEMIRRAKHTHDLLEDYYKEAMIFSKLQGVRDDILEELTENKCSAP